MSKIYTFWSVNGGVGKTTLSSVTAYNLAKKYKNKKILLLDYNLVNPDTDIHLKLNPLDLKELYRYLVSDTLTEEVFLQHIKEYPRQYNFHILSGLYDINYFDKIDLKHFLTILEVAKKVGYDYIFIDIDSSVNIDATFVALTNADKIFVVTDAMYHSIRNTNRYLEEVLSKINIYDEKIEIIVNKYDDEISDKGEIKKLLNCPSAIFIEFNKIVPKSVNKGIPFVEVKDRKAKKLLEQIDNWTEYITTL